MANHEFAAIASSAAITHVKRVLGDTSSAPSDEQRAKVERRLVARTSVPKSSIAKILVELHAHGMLADGVLGNTNENEVRKHISKAVAANADEVTPYGPVMQTIVLDAQPPYAAFRWDFIHPLALLLLLAKLSCNFAAVLLQCVAARSGAHPIVIYIDEVRPGNVLRPDKGRATQNIFWATASWPEWLLCRANAWLTFGRLRSCVVEKLPGGVSNLMRQVLLKFFDPAGPSFATGVALNAGGSSVLFCCYFASFIGDEKGLKDNVALYAFGVYLKHGSYF